MIKKKGNLIVEVDGFKVGGTYRITYGFFTDHLITIDWISPNKTNRTAHGNVDGKKLPINVPIIHLSTNTDKPKDNDAKVRQIAKQLLLQGKREQALKLLQTLNKNQ